jgi:hypothetical protein
LSNGPADGEHDPTSIIVLLTCLSKAAGTRVIEIGNPVYFAAGAAGCVSAEADPFVEQALLVRRILGVRAVGREKESDRQGEELK